VVQNVSILPNLILAGITLASADDYLAHMYNTLGFQEALTDSQKGRCVAYIIYYIFLSMLFFPILPFLVNWFENKQNNRCANITNFIVFLVIFLFTLFVIPVPSYFVFQAFLFIAVIWYGVWGCKKHHQNESAEKGILNDSDSSTSYNTNNDISNQSLKQPPSLTLSNRRVPTNTSGMFYVNRKHFKTGQKSMFNNSIRYTIS